VSMSRVGRFRDFVNLNEANFIISEIPIFASSSWIVVQNTLISLGFRVNCRSGINRGSNIANDMGTLAPLMRIRYLMHDFGRRRMFSKSIVPDMD